MTGHDRYSRDRNVPQFWRRGACRQNYCITDCQKGRLVSGKVPGGPPPEGPGWWDPNDEGLCIWAAYQPRWAASLAASYIDLSGNGNNASDPGGAATPTWDATNGWKFDHTVPEYLTTTFLPDPDQTQSMIIQFSNYTGGGSQMFGGTYRASTSRYHVGTSFGSAVYADGGWVTDATFSAAGNIATAGTAGYFNGVSEANLGAAPALAFTFPAWIGAGNNGGATYLPASVYIQAFALYDCALTAGEVLAVATAMAAI